VRPKTREWTTYRTRFLIKARQLDEPLTFVDCLGREHSGQTGDYLVQSSDGAWRITPREIFEDVYVPIEQPGEAWESGVQLSSGLPRTLLAEAQRLNLQVSGALQMSPSGGRGNERPGADVEATCLTPGRRFMA
jgi:hypothetical protein